MQNTFYYAYCLSIWSISCLTFICEFLGQKTMDCERDISRRCRERSQERVNESKWVAKNDRASNGNHHGIDGLGLDHRYKFQSAQIGGQIASTRMWRRRCSLVLRWFNDKPLRCHLYARSFHWPGTSRWTSLRLWRRLHGSRLSMVFNDQAWLLDNVCHVHARILAPFRNVGHPRPHRQLLSAVAICHPLPLNVYKNSKSKVQPYGRSGFVESG